jgi:hypothetical protein
MTNLDKLADAIRADEIRQGIRGTPVTWAEMTSAQRDSYRSMALAVCEADDAVRHGPEKADETDTLINQLIATKNPLSAKAALAIRALRFEKRNAAA